MKINVRLYRMHDYDLISLKYTKSICFSAMIKSILKSYAEGDMYNVEIPIPTKKNVKDLPYITQTQFKLDEVKDKVVIDMLNNIKDGYRNNFIKNLVRQYIKFGCLVEYFEDGDWKTHSSIMHSEEKVGSVAAFKNKQKTVQEIEKQIFSDNNEKNETFVTINKEKEEKIEEKKQELPKKESDDSQENVFDILTAMMNGFGG